KDVRSVEWRHESTVGEVVDLMRDVVTSMLDLPQLSMMAPFLVQRAVQLAKRFADQRALAVEQFVKAELARNDVQFDARFPKGRLEVPSGISVAAVSDLEPLDGADRPVVLAWPCERRPRCRTSVRSTAPAAQIRARRPAIRSHAALARPLPCPSSG